MDRRESFPRCILAEIDGEPNRQNYRNSTWWKKNMRFMRLKTLELGYTLPQSVTDKIHSKAIRFYVSGNNLFCFSPFKLWDRN